MLQGNKQDKTTDLHASWHLNPQNNCSRIFHYYYFFSFSSRFPKIWVAATNANHEKGLFFCGQSVCFLIWHVPWTSDPIFVWLRVLLLLDFHLGMPDLTCSVPVFIQKNAIPIKQREREIKVGERGRYIRTNKEEEEKGDWIFLIYKEKERVVESRGEALLCKRLLRAHSTPGSMPDMMTTSIRYNDVNQLVYAHSHGMEWIKYYY